VPEVAFKVPEVPDGFIKHETEGLVIYIQKSALVGADHIDFKLRGFWIFKGIVAEGLKFPSI
jgi:hypothetical protein